MSFYNSLSAKIYADALLTSNTVAEPATIPDATVAVKVASRGVQVPAANAVVEIVEAVVLLNLNAVPLEIVIVGVPRFCTKNFNDPKA